MKKDESTSKKGILYQRYIKRMVDIFLSMLALIILCPVLLVVAVLVRVKLGGPVLFMQKRPGLHERIFTMYKFRTMTDERNENGDLLPDSMRLTKFGKILRSTSLDELPELINILIGDMSIVGPRPQLVRDMVFMTPDQRRRHTARPGLTGLAQVNGRNAISWENKLNYDLEYINKYCFLIDCQIVLQTIGKVIRRECIVSLGLDTAEDFGDYLLRIKKVSYQEYQDCLREANNLIHMTR